MDINKTVDQIIDWAEDRGIFDEGTIYAQLAKLDEEYKETVTAFDRGDMTDIIDGIGDMFVVLVILAEMSGTNLPFCADAAYKEISKRKGKMKGGVFVKESDNA